LPSPIPPAQPKVQLIKVLFISRQSHFGCRSAEIIRSAHEIITKTEGSHLAQEQLLKVALQLRIAGHTAPVVQVADPVGRVQAMGTKLAAHDWISGADGSLKVDGPRFFY